MPVLVVPWLGCNAPEDVGVVGNSPPEAALRAPVIAPIGVPIRLDASAAIDLDGDPLTYTFEFGDGSEALASPSPVVEHTFDHAMLVTVAVRVRDLFNAEAWAEQDIALRADYPSPPDFCDANRPCVVGDECAAGICYANGGGL